MHVRKCRLQSRARLHASVVACAVTSPQNLRDQSLLRISRIPLLMPALRSALSAGHLACNADEWLCACRY